MGNPAEATFRHPKQIASTTAKDSKTSAKVNPCPLGSAKLAHFCSRCGPHLCTMKITEDVRKYVAEQGSSDRAALKQGMEEKSREFTEKGDELYAKA